MIIAYKMCGIIPSFMVCSPLATPYVAAAFTVHRHVSNQEQKRKSSDRDNMGRNARDIHAYLPDWEKVNCPRARVLFSTPFDMGMYDIDDDSELNVSSNPFQPTDEEDHLFTTSPLAVSQETQLVLGINKYSHDTTLCAADATTGQVLFAVSKERITRKKHDGGNIAGLVETCLDQLDLNLDSVVKVVMNNHHHRILPFIERSSRHMEWEEGLKINGGVEDGYCDEYNILSTVDDKIEMSHHLAHAYSAAAQSTFEEGMVVVMDGMGETYKTMKNAIEVRDQSYVSDFSICMDNEVIELIPSDLEKRAKMSNFDWREAESVYVFDKDNNNLNIKPIFKRFTQENTPPALYNHGFENMDSLGAVYSRASSHIFGDWNACGKVMGLAPWYGHVWKSSNNSGGNNGETITAEMIENPILQGKLHQDYAPEKGDGIGGLKINRISMMGTPFIARFDPEMFDEEGKLIRPKRYDFDDNKDEKRRVEDNKSITIGNEPSQNQDEATKQIPTKVALDAISLASRMQTDLETIAMDFVNHFKTKTGQSNLCLSGGVALNSVLNGRLSRELGFSNTFIPPYPGDDGIAVGCCAFGLFGSRKKPSEKEKLSMPTIWKEPLSPYLGPLPTELSMKEAIEWAAPWLNVEKVRDEKQRIDSIVEEIAAGGIVALYHGRSELGPRALGHRSILADPRKKGLVRFINEFVKKRESFRPFAPSVLAEEAANWFDLGGYAAATKNNVSPYMSITAQVKDSRRSLVPAVTHVDGSSRLQTVTREAEPYYHRIISAFYKLTGVPMILNTSFNTLKNEPIVETPRNAIRSFLSSMGAIEILVMGDYVIKRREANIRKLLGEEQKNGILTPPSFPTRAGMVNYKTSFSVGSQNDGSKISMSDHVTRVQMPNRPMHDEKDDGWFELLDDLEGQILGVCDGSLGVNEIMTQFLAMSEEENDNQFDRIVDYDQILFENIVRRLIRLYEHTFISW